MKKILKNLKQLLSDDNKNFSFLRFFLFFMIFLLIWLVYLWSYAFLKEISLLSDNFRVDYLNLYSGLGVLLGSGLLGLIFKVIQKKHENGSGKGNDQQGSSES